MREGKIIQWEVPGKIVPVVGMALFKDRLYVATTQGLWVKDEDRDLMVPVKFLSAEEIDA